jgi:hypothetical protein
MAVVRFASARCARLGFVGIAVPALLCLASGGVASAGSFSAPVPVPVAIVTMSVAGHLTDTTAGQGIRGMCVEIRNDSGTTVAKATTESDGSYVATWKENPGTTPVQYGAVATPYCGAAGLWEATSSPNAVTLTAEPGQNSAAGVDMQAAPAGRIVGKITDDSTVKPIAGVSVGFAVGDGSGSPDIHRSRGDDASGWQLPPRRSAGRDL